MGTAIVEQMLGPDLLLMPNPTDGMLVVQLSDERYQSGTLYLRSLDGRIVKQQRMSGARAELDLNGLNTGAYWIELITADGHVTGAKLLKY